MSSDVSLKVKDRINIQDRTDKKLYGATIIYESSGSCWALTDNHRYLFGNGDTEVSTKWPELIEVQDEHFEKKLLLRNLLIGFPERFDLLCKALDIPNGVRSYIKALELILPDLSSPTIDADGQLVESELADQRFGTVD